MECHRRVGGVISARPYQVAPSGGMWIWPLAPWVGMGGDVQTNAVLVRCCHAIVEHLGLLVVIIF